MKDLLPMVQCVLFLAIMLAWPTPTTSATLRADLTHVDSGLGLTKRELLRRMAARSTSRAASLGAAARAVTAPVTRGTTGKTEIDSEYLVHFGIGRPSPQPVALALDTGSDLVWTQCACTACFPQPFPALDPSASRTFRAVPCTDPFCSKRGGLPDTAPCGANQHLCVYAYTYGDKSVTRGTINRDTFTFSGGVAVPSLRFSKGHWPIFIRIEKRVCGKRADTGSAS